MKIFIDTDVILDVVLNRNFPESINLFSKIETDSKLTAYTSPIVVVNTHYTASKIINRSAGIKTIRKLRALLNIIPTNQKHIDLALASDFKDFEDAVQYYAALEAGINAIITRNKRDYKPSQIAIFNPKEFLATLNTN